MTPRDQATQMTPSAVRDWLGGPRFERYVAAARGNEDLALELYAWNSKVAAATLGDLGHLEVALRNSYDRSLSAQYPDWAIDPSSRLCRRVQGMEKARVTQRKLNDDTRAQLAAAAKGLGGNPSHGQVLAALSFGFWGAMTRHERTSTFWTPLLIGAYPHGITRGRVHELVQNLIRFRNRLAHNEPVFSTRTGLARRIRDLDALFEMLHPAASQWVKEQSTVTTLVVTCPVSELVLIEPPPAR